MSYAVPRPAPRPWRRAPGTAHSRSVSARDGTPWQSCRGRLHRCSASAAHPPRPTECRNAEFKYCNKSFLPLAACVLRRWPQDMRAQRPRPCSSRHPRGLLQTARHRPSCRGAAPWRGHTEAIPCCLGIRETAGDAETALQQPDAARFATAGCGAVCNSRVRPAVARPDGIGARFHPHSLGSRHRSARSNRAVPVARSERRDLRKRTTRPAGRSGDSPENPGGV